MLQAENIFTKEELDILSELDIDKINNKEEFILAVEDLFRKKLINIQAEQLIEDRNNYYNAIKKG